MAAIVLTVAFVDPDRVEHAVVLALAVAGITALNGRIQPEPPPEIPESPEERRRLDR